ncbi:MAG: DUF4870 domain-containing protein [Coriobacteriales bacterium]|jgi:uncharacterized Tic20 family protein|nr:DUF4870 domain-containing protein [Coriobacteriales bacterium]
MSYEDLKALDELRKTGAITEAEYEQEKQKVLSGTGAPQSAPAPGAVPPPPPPGYQQAPAPYAAQPTGNKPLFGMAENTYLMLMHLSLFLGFLLPVLGLAAPIILWVINKDTNPRVDATGKRIFNFLISFAIYSFVAGLLIIILIGGLLLLALGVAALIFIILAAVKANNGEDWDYPLTIKFFH